MFTTTSADGTSVQAYDEGTGPVVLVLHPGLDDGSSWRKVAARLAGTSRMLRVHRRQYRLDVAGLPCTIAQEVADVLAVVHAVGAPVLIVGHSSGGIVALEALVASPSSFTAAVLYEPPVVLDEPLGGVALERASAALAAGRPGRAFAIFMRHVVRLPGWVSWLVGAVVAVVPRYRRLVPGQIADNRAIDELGNRLTAYAAIATPTVLLSGDRSPAHLIARIDALAAALPNAERVTLPGRDHSAHLKAPDEVARVIADVMRRYAGHPSGS